MIHRSLNSLLGACAALVVGCGMAWAWDGTSITYINAQLEQREGTLLDLRDGNARIRDANSRERQIPTTQLAAIIFESASAADGATLETQTLIGGGSITGQGLIITTDRQRLRGRPLEGDPGAEAVLWDGPPFGARVFSLESLVVFRPGSGSEVAMPARLDHDVIIFKNADRAPTFIESIIASRPEPILEPDPPAGLSPRDTAAWRRARRLDRNGAALRRSAALVAGVVRAEVQDRPMEIPLERIQAITFANPFERPGAMPRVWLTDSSVVASGSLLLDVPQNVNGAITRRLGDASIQIEAAGERATLVLSMPESGPGSRALDHASPATPPAADSNGRVPLQRVEAVAFDASRLVPLSACAFRSEALSSSERRWTPPARIERPAGRASVPLDAHDILLPGPMQLMVDLPATTTHVGGVIALPRSSRPLGSCRVTVTIVDARGGSHEVVMVDLSAQSATHAIAAAMPMGGKGPFGLRITLDPGEDGPIQDSALLQRFLVLIEP